MERPETVASLSPVPMPNSPGGVPSGGFLGADDAAGIARCPCCGGPVTADELLIDAMRGRIARGGFETRVTRMEAAVLSALSAVRPGVLTKEAFYDRLYGDRADGGPGTKVLDVMVCKLRPKLTAIGLRIETHWGRGYALVDGAGPSRAAEGVAVRELRFAGTRHDATVRALLARGLKRQAIAQRCGISYATAEKIIARVRAAEAPAAPDGRGAA
ncbi:hypothetical protein ABB55_27705 [Prosthecomicrobium hirschii]|uniref:OmpR/PhoB-type domain-containing protein n=1 Tax=Prosthecodimorpha hirschii TaxID=665126 RepID=A0A0P6W8Q8_9HYPH|nr:hypothetical protein ABB55_27705 [Prosthecomicrobium hirschii]